MNLSEVEHMYLIVYAKASPVAKDLVDSIDGRNHTRNIIFMRVRGYDLRLFSFLFFKKVAGGSL